MNVRNVAWAVFAIIVLAGLDLIGAYLAKEFSLRPSWLIMAGGVVAFSLLFIVYVRSLRITELWIVTFGWVVMLEVGVLLLDRFRFSTEIPWHKLLLAAVIVTLQVFLLLPPQVSPGSSPSERKPARDGRSTQVSATAPRPLPFAWSNRPAESSSPIIVVGGSARRP